MSYQMVLGMCFTWLLQIHAHGNKLSNLSIVNVSFNMLRINRLSNLYAKEPFEGWIGINEEFRFTCNLCMIVLWQATEITVEHGSLRTLDCGIITPEFGIA